LVNPESGELIEFSGKLVDAGYCLKLIKDQIKMYDQDIRNALIHEALEMIQSDPALGMTRHFEGERARVSVGVKREPKFEAKDLEQFRAVLGEAQFKELFTEQLTYKPKAQNIKTFLKTKTDDKALEEIREMIQNRFDNTEFTAILKFDDNS
jgi:hypothetical protein